MNGHELYDLVCSAPGLTRTDEDDAIVLTHENGNIIRVRTNARGGYLASLMGSMEVPAAWGIDLGNGTILPNTQSKLARWGIETRKDRLERMQRQERKAEREAARQAEQVAQAPPTPSEEPMPQPKSSIVDGILSDPETSSGLIVARVLELAKQSGAAPFTERGATVYDWHGDLYRDVLYYLWSDLPKEPTAEEMGALQIHRIYTDLCRPLQQAGILRKQVRLDISEEIWRVRDDAPADDVPAAASAPIAPTAEKAPVSPPPAPAVAEATVTVPPEPITPAPEEDPHDVKIYTCADCAFADASETTLQSHHNKFRARPEEHAKQVLSLPCPAPRCVSVRTTPENYRKHLVEEHPDLYPRTRTMCKHIECLDWFDTRSAYTVHVMEAHPEQLRHREPVKPEPLPEITLPPAPTPAPVAAKPAPPKKAPAAPAAKPAPAPAAVAVGTAPTQGETVEQAAIRMLREHGQQQETIESLRAEIEELRARNMDLAMKLRDAERTLKGFRRKLDALFTD